MRVLVVTIVHHPEDARIAHREIPALVEAGHEVTYVAPFTDCDATPPEDVGAIEVPRSIGRRRWLAIKAARRVIQTHAPSADLMLLHDPELLLSVAGLRDLPPVVWDVHEDTAAVLSLKKWLPVPLRPLAAAGVHSAERWAERRHQLLLADESFRSRFRRSWPVVPNTTQVPEDVPPPAGNRVIYVGRLTRDRGAFEMIELARLVAPSGIRVELLGQADSEVQPAVEAARDEGILHWRGFVPNRVAKRRLEGALAGLSLLHDEVTHRHAQPARVIEYMAHGVPVVTTPQPVARSLVEGYGAGIVVPYGDARAAAEAVLKLRDDPAMRERAGWYGHAVAVEQFHWPSQAKEFVRQLEEWAETDQTPTRTP